MKSSDSAAPVVHLIDDDDSLRTALTRLLRAAGHAVSGYASAAEFLLARQGPLRGCVLLDVRMPGGPSGLELQRALVKQGEFLPIIFLTGHGDIPMSVQAIKNGAFDFLTKPVARETLLKAVGDALERDGVIWQEGDRRREATARMEQLTPSEGEVFRRVLEAQPNKRIAAELGCSERTVKAHRAQVMAKMGTATLVELVQIAGILNQESIR